jgi:hypothetical protein
MNVVNSAPARTASGEPSTDVEQAARTLLDLYASLRKAQSSGAELGGVIHGARIGKHEPYI